MIQLGDSMSVYFKFFLKSQIFLIVCFIKIALSNSKKYFLTDYITNYDYDGDYDNYGDSDHTEDYDEYDFDEYEY